MKLAAFDKPVSQRIGCPGVLCGIPTVCVSCFGCNAECDLCNTAGVWAEHAPTVDVSVEDILTKMREPRLSHAFIGGGDPILQLNEVLDLAQSLRTEWMDEGGWRFGMHVSLATPALIFDEAVARHVDMLCLHPKLSNWNEDVIRSYLQSVMSRPQRQAQVTVNCGWDADSVVTAIDRLYRLFSWADSVNISAGKVVHLGLQPEYSLGPRAEDCVIEELEKWMRNSISGHLYPPIRVLSQTYPWH